MLSSQLLEPPQGFVPECRGVACDLDLTFTFQVRDAAVERCDQLLEAADQPGPVYIALRRVGRAHL